MVPPENSGSSDNDSSDQEENIEADYASNYCSSPLSSNADENELDALLLDFEMNPFEEVNINSRL